MGTPPNPALSGLLTLVALLAGTGAGAADRLVVDPHDSRLASRPELREKITGTAHGYFRFVNNAFAAEACAAFGDVADRFPDVNLHGDAHVEQYTVTNLGLGLSDFDDCTQGKPIIDLVRFGTSLVLAARQKGWSDGESEAVEEFLRGYDDALENPNRFSSRPSLGWEIFKSFQRDHAAALERAHSLIDAAPLDPGAFDEMAGEFAGLIRFGRDDLPPHFFAVKRVGALRMGVGSALDEKYLILFEGPTVADTDDLIVEAKQVRDLSGNPCVKADVMASRILDGERLIAYEPFRYSAVVPRGGKYFWIHDWTDDYQEASIADVLRTREDLEEIAYDAGLQLGRAHPKRVDGTTDEERQRATRRAVKRYGARIRTTVFRLADETEAAWRTFSEAAGRLSSN
jgi:hypothetical protein